MNDYFNEFAKLAIARGLISEADDSTSRLDPGNIAKTKELYNLKKEKSLKDHSDDAHKEMAIVSPSHNKLNGVVPDLYQQQNIDINIVNKKTNGQLGRVKTCQHELATSLISIANFNDESDEQIRILADTCLLQLKKEANWFTNVLSKAFKAAPLANAAGKKDKSGSPDVASIGVAALPLALRGGASAAAGAAATGTAATIAAETAAITGVTATAPIWGTVALVGASVGAVLLAGNWLLNRLDEPVTNINVTVENIDDLLSDMLKFDWSWFEDELSETFIQRLNNLKTISHEILDSYNKNYPVLEKLRTLNIANSNKAEINSIISAKNELVNTIISYLPQIKALYRDIQNDDYITNAIKNPSGIDKLLGRAKSFFSGRMGLVESNYKELEDYLGVLIANCEGILNIKSIEEQCKEKIESAKSATKEVKEKDISDEQLSSWEKEFKKQ
jgi:hypothetical protein